MGEFITKPLTDEVSLLQLLAGTEVRGHSEEAKSDVDFPGETWLHKTRWPGYDE